MNLQKYATELETTIASLRTELSSAQQTIAELREGLKKAQYTETLTPCPNTAHDEEEEEHNLECIGCGEYKCAGCMTDCWLAQWIGGK